MKNGTPSNSEDSQGLPGMRNKERGPFLAEPNQGDTYCQGRSYHFYYSRRYPQGVDYGQVKPKTYNQAL